MNPFDKFFSDFLLKGLEYFNKYYGNYRGSVIDNRDPENLGRLKISCNQIYGTDNPNIWVFPVGMVAASGSGMYWIPPIGAPIYITCENGDPRFPLWKYGWFLKGKGITGAQPGVHIFQTPYGLRIELNDNTKVIDIKHQTGFHVKIYQDGIYLGKENDNLGKRIDDLFNLFANTTITTPDGTFPFTNVANYATLRAQFKLFLKDS